MEINDYTKRLAQKNDQFEQNLQKISQNHKQEVDNLKQLHDYREKKQIGTHQDQTQKLEDAYAHSIDRQNAKNIQEINDRQNEFLAQKKKLGDETAATKAQLAQEFNRRLDHIKNNYAKISEDQQLEDGQKIDYLAKKSQERLDRQRQDYLDQTDKYSENANKKLANSVQAFQRDKEQLLDNFTKDRDQVTKKNNAEKNIQKNYYEKNLEDIKRANLDRAQEEKNYYQSRLDGIGTKNKIDRDFLYDQFSKASEANQNKMTMEERSQAADHVDAMKKLEGNFGADLRKIKKDAQRVTSREGRDEQHDLEKKLIANSFNNQLRSRDNYLKEIREHGQRENQKMKDSYTNAVKLKNEKYADKIANFEQEFRNHNKALLSKTSEERTQLLENNRIMLKDTNQRADAKVMSAEKIHQEELKNYQRYHNNTIAKIVEKNFQALSELKAGFVEDKRDFVIKHQQETHDKVENLKDFYRQQMLKIAESYQQQIDQLQNKLAVKDVQLEDKVQTLEGRFNSQVENSNVANAAKQVEDQRFFRQQLVAKEQDYERRFIEQKSQLQQQVNNVAMAKDAQIKAIINRYEQEIPKLQKDLQTQMQRKLAEAKQAQLKIMEDYETRLISMRSQYEARMDQIRQEKS